MFEDELELKAKDGSVESKKGACELLGPIRRAKYPDVTAEEERISLPLQPLRLDLKVDPFSFVVPGDAERSCLSAAGRWIVDVLQLPSRVFSP